MSSLKRARSLTSICLFFANNDWLLCHALESGCVPLRGKAKEEYCLCINERLARLEALEAREQDDPEAEFRAWLNHAEATLSLVYNPPADPETSWWAVKIRKTVQDLVDDAKSKLAARTGKEVAVHWPLGTHEDEKKWTKNDIVIPRNFEPGKIAACLKPHVRIGGRETQRGRVIHHRY